VNLTVVSRLQHWYVNFVQLLQSVNYQVSTRITLAKQGYACQTSKLKPLWYDHLSY